MTPHNLYLVWHGMVKNLCQLPYEIYKHKYNNEKKKWCQLWIGNSAWEILSQRGTPQHLLQTSVCQCVNEWESSEALTKNQDNGTVWQLDGLDYLRLGSRNSRQRWTDSFVEWENHFGISRGQCRCRPTRWRWYRWQWSCTFTLEIRRCNRIFIV